jgi:hypothetical protein
VRGPDGHLDGGDGEHVAGNGAYIGALTSSPSWGFLLAAQLAAAPPAQAPPVRTAQQQYKNLQVLRDIPANQTT